MADGYERMSTGFKREQAIVGNRDQTAALGPAKGLRRLFQSSGEIGPRSGRADEPPIPAARTLITEPYNEMSIVHPQRLIPTGAGADSVKDSKSRENLILSER